MKTHVHPFQVSREEMKTYLSDRRSAYRQAHIPTQDLDSFEARFDRHPGESVRRIIQNMECRSDRYEHKMVAGSVGGIVASVAAGGGAGLLLGGPLGTVVGGIIGGVGALVSTVVPTRNNTRDWKDRQNFRDDLVDFASSAAEKLAPEEPGSRSAAASQPIGQGRENQALARFYTRTDPWYDAIVQESATREAEMKQLFGTTK